MQERSHLNMQLPNADTIDFFFFGPRKRGVRPHPPNPPDYVPGVGSEIFIVKLNDKQQSDDRRATSDDRRLTKVNS